MIARLPLMVRATMLLTMILILLIGVSAGIGATRQSVCLDVYAKEDNPSTDSEEDFLYARVDVIHQKVFRPSPGTHMALVSGAKSHHIHVSPDRTRIAIAGYAASPEQGAFLGIYAAVPAMPKLYFARGSFFDPQYVHMMWSADSKYLFGWMNDVHDGGNSAALFMIDLAGKFRLRLVFGQPNLALEHTTSDGHMIWRDGEKYELWSIANFTKIRNLPANLLERPESLQVDLTPDAVSSGTQSAFNTQFVASRRSKEVLIVNTFAGSRWLLSFSDELRTNLRWSACN
jgi:hypothetical protein